LLNQETPSLSDAAREALAEIRVASVEVRALRLALDAEIPLPIEDDVRWALASTSDADTAVLAIEAATRHAMDREVEAAINHRFAHVAARALTAFATRLAPPCLRVSSRSLNTVPARSARPLSTFS